MAGLLLASVFAFFLAVSAEHSYSVGKFQGTFVDHFRNEKVDVLIYYPNNASSGTTFPLVVFGPGFIQSNTFYDYLWQALVPLGYVFALDGTYNYNPVYEPMKSGRNLAFLRDYIRNQSISNPQFPTFGMINNKAATMGHSFGGAGCMLSADADVVGHEYSCDFDSVVTISPCRWQDDTEYSALSYGNHTAFLAISATTDCVCPPVIFSRHWYNISTSTCKVFAEIVKGAHCGFEEPNPEDDGLCRILEDFSFCPPVGYIPRLEQLSLTTSWVVPWLDLVLRGNTGAWPTLQQELQVDAASDKAQYLDDMSSCTLL